MNTYPKAYDRIAIGCAVITALGIILVLSDVAFDTFYLLANHLS